MPAPPTSQRSAGRKTSRGPTGSDLTSFCVPSLRVLFGAPGRDSPFWGRPSLAALHHIVHGSKQTLDDWAQKALPQRSCAEELLRPPACFCLGAFRAL